MIWSFVIELALAGHVWRASHDTAWWTFGPHGHGFALAAIKRDTIAAIACFWGRFTQLRALSTSRAWRGSGIN
jgi:hypothetical protein